MSVGPKHWEPSGLPDLGQSQIPEDWVSTAMASQHLEESPLERFFCPCNLGKHLRIIESFELERTLKSNLVPLPCHKQGRPQLHQVLRAPSSLTLGDVGIKEVRNPSDVRAGSMGRALTGICSPYTGSWQEGCRFFLL